MSGKVTLDEVADSDAGEDGAEINSNGDASPGDLGEGEGIGTVEKPADLIETDHFPTTLTTAPCTPIPELLSHGSPTAQTAKMNGGTTPVTGLSPTTQNNVPENARNGNPLAFQELSSFDLYSCNFSSTSNWSAHSGTLPTEFVFGNREFNPSMSKGN